MPFAKSLLLGCALILLACAAVNAQQAPTLPAAAVVPQLVNFSGKAVDALGKPISGIVGVTFAIYKDQYEGAPLWMETQNVTADGKGNYTVQLGAATASGLPLDLFSTGEARWLGVRINGGEEQPRVLLLSVPYALKAADAQTLAGLPASAFMLASPAVAVSNVDSAGANPNGANPDGSAPPPASSDVTTSGGAANALPLFTTATNVQNSILTQTATTAINVAGKLNLPATGAATASKGFASRPLDFVASSFNSATAAPVTQTFQWQAEPANNNTANPSAVLSLLYGSGTTAPAETGLRIGPKGIIAFAPGQTFPGGGSGITDVKAGTDLTGGGTSGSVTLNLDTTKVPILEASNSFSGNNSFGGTGGFPIFAQTSAASGIAMQGRELSTSGPNSTGVYGSTQDATGSGVSGYNSGSSAGQSALGIGVNGTSVSGIGVAGNGGPIGVYGQADGGINPFNQYAPAAGVYGVSFSNRAVAIEGVGFTPSYGSEEGGGTGLYSYGGNSDTSERGLVGGDGLDSFGGGGSSGDGAGGRFFGGGGTSNGDGIDVTAGSGVAAFFVGDVVVSGTVQKSGGAFKIDHPLDPANKYLSHSFVESPDMKNIYDGVATLDANGESVIRMPEWFGVLNRDFRYQLTCIGGFAPVYIAEELANNQFKIGGGRPGMRVSWQITGIRQDVWANAHRIPVEEEKEGRLKGFYIHPELYGAPPEKQIEYARHPQTLKNLLQQRQAMEQKPARMAQSAIQPPRTSN